MADGDICKDIKLLKNTKISVFVDDALPDILVVTYEFGLRIFKGVLLDSTKRNLPCGVPHLNPAFEVPTKGAKEDPLYSVSQRFAYMEPGNAKKRNVHISSKYKNSRMTVRLRPRQVLCSKCKGICNENSENVSRKRKLQEKGGGGGEASSPSVAAQLPKRSIDAPVTRSVNVLAAVRRPPRDRSGAQQQQQQQQTEQQRQNATVTSQTLVPYLTRLTNVVAELDENNVGSHKVVEPSSTNCLDVVKKRPENLTNGNEQTAASDANVEPQVPPAKLKRMFRKRRIGSEQWEDTNSQSIIVSSSTTVPASLSTTTTSTRTIKISYGPQGEGTVLKIPAESLEDDSEENNMNVQHDTKKASKKALRRARKEARKRIMFSTPVGGASPRFKNGGSSPRYTVGSASPRQGLGNNSPRYKCSQYEINMPKKRKHKVKHKKKHKEDKDRRHKEGEVNSTQDDSKEQCITQKLSINLRRLNNTYTPSLVLNVDPSSSDDGNCSHGAVDDDLGAVPDFPQVNPSLMLRINAQAVTSAVGADGGRLLVGDVVWGKIRGFHWWPGKILTLTNSSNQGTQAHVAWYGSTTSSLVQCDQLSHYLDNFKFLYNKKIKGPYKEAVKRATTEAKENAEAESNRVRQPLGNSPSHNIIQVVPPALASPREINVAS